MTTTNKATVLKDVVAYVDVWSSDKMANYSKPFIQQLQEMGAQVTKTFNKQVTHVVFNNGHLATWKKAKKSDVRLVSVLWVSKCHDDGVHVDEALYPALNDESNPVLKNKKHRCMQPKDIPVKTPENDRRMKKKLDQMMKDLAPKEPLVTDVSPIIIDEENGIVYSPAWKRSDYMAQRLEDMKNRRENLSPTASQMVESCSPTGLKPSLGSTPTVFKLMFEQSDDDSSASVADPGYSPDKEEGRTHLDVGDHDQFQQSHRKDSMKPWLSPCRDIPESKQSSSVSDCADFTKKEDEKGNTQKTSRRMSVRRKAAEKCESVDVFESPRQDKRTVSSKNIHEEKRQTASCSSLPTKTEKGKQKTTAAKPVTETKPHIYSDTVNPSSSLTSGVVAADVSEHTATLIQKTERKTSKRARPSLSALVKSFSLSVESKEGTTDGDDDVFEDYFSPANHHHRSTRPLLPNLPVDNDPQIPFELGPVPGKRKQRRSESFETKKKRKLDESQSGKNVHQQSDVRNENHQEDVKESLPALDSLSSDVTLMNKRRRQSTLAFTNTSKTASDTLKRRRSTSVQQKQDNAVPELQKNSDFSVLSHTMESRGNECTVAAGFTEVPSEAEENPNGQVSLCPQNKSKAMRTLVMTSMPTEKQHTVIQVVKSLGGFSVVDQVCESTTHVVAGGPRRTLNILLGIARGCWILSYEWILWCLEQRQWVPEEPYELSDHFPAAQICRLQRHLSAGEHQQDLFQGQPPMFVSQHSQPPPQSLEELIELCGGTVCKTVRQAGLCIGKYNGRIPEGSRILSEQWVLDSITHLKQLSYENYLLE